MVGQGHRDVNRISAPRTHHVKRPLRAPASTTTRHRPSLSRDRSTAGDRTAASRLGPRASGRSRLIGPRRTKRAWTPPPSAPNSRPCPPGSADSRAATSSNHNSHDPARPCRLRCRALWLARSPSSLKEAPGTLVGKNRTMDRSRSHWARMSPGRRAFTVFAMSFRFVTAVLALASLARRPAEDIRGRKWVWAVAIVANLAVGIFLHWEHLATPSSDHEAVVGAAGRR